MNVQHMMSFTRPVHVSYCKWQVLGEVWACGGEPGNEATWWFVVEFSTRASEPHYQGSIHGLQSHTNEDHTHYINFSIETSAVH